MNLVKNVEILYNQNIIIKKNVDFKKNQQNTELTNEHNLFVQISK